MLTAFSRVMRRLGGFHGMIVMAVYRFGNWIFYRVRVPGVRHILWLIYRIFDFALVRLVLGAEFPARCKIGRNLHLPHGGNGIILNGYTTIGDDVTIYHQVTLGVRRSDTNAPVIGNGVLLGAGAKVLGPVRVGDGAKIGANAVVLADVPANATAVGVPAKIRSREADDREGAV